MTPQVPDLLRELAKAVESYVQHAAAAQTAAAERDRVSALLREEAPDLFGGAAMSAPKAAIVAPVTPTQDDWRRRGLVPPPGKLSKNAYATRLGLKSNALSSHKEALDAAIDAEGWIDIAQADAILIEKTKEDSILGKAVRALQEPVAAAEPEVLEAPAPIERAPEPPSTPVVIEGWPELSPLARMANKAAQFIRLRDSRTVEPVDPQNREGDWTIGSRIFTAVQLIQEARRKGAPLPSPTEIAA